MSLHISAFRAATRPVRVLVVDDNEGFRESLVMLLDTEELHVVGQGSDGEEAMGLVDALSPDVVLMDVRMPMTDGIEATRRIKAHYPHIGIVALTGSEDQRAVRDMLVAGASGYVLKDSDGDEILNAVHQAAMGGGVISPEVTPTVIDELTEALERERRRTRQLEVAQEALLERSARRHELVSRLGHELRTPVTVILGMAQTLAKGTAPLEERPVILETLVDRAEALARLVQRFEAAVEAGLTEWADVTQVAREVAELHERVEVDAPPGPAMASLNRTAAQTDPRGARRERPRVLRRHVEGHDRREHGRRLARGARRRPRRRRGARRSFRASSTPSSRARSSTPGRIRASGSASRSRGCRRARWTATWCSNRRDRTAPRSCGPVSQPPLT